MKAAADGFGERGSKPYRQAGRIAVIGIAGTLVHRSGFVRPASGMTGYDGIQHQLEAALADPGIKGILLDIDSPGGEVSGALDLADMIYQARGQKPIWALADEKAASAAFALASSAHRVVVPRTAMVGSIGVLFAHVDRSKQLDKAGLAVTLVHAGARKVDGNPFEPLPADVRADMQAEIDSLYKLFVSTVARNRGLSDAKVRGTEARLFTGQAAVSAGLADEVMPAHDVLGAFDAHLRGHRSGIRTTSNASTPQPARSMNAIASRYYAQQ